jgi:hypothetical protein
LSKRQLAEALIRDNVLAARAVAALQLHRLDESTRERVHQAIAARTGILELRTRIETAETELVLVPTDGSEPLWLTRTFLGTTRTFRRLSPIVSADVRPMPPSDARNTAARDRRARPADRTHRVLLALATRRRFQA